MNESFLRNYVPVPRGGGLSGYWKGGFVRVCGGARVRAGIKLASGFTYYARVERIFCQLLNKISKQKLIVTVIKDFNHHTFQVFSFSANLIYRKLFL